MRVLSRVIPGDWHSGSIPDSVEFEPNTLIETSYSFRCVRSHRPGSIRLGDGTGIYSGTNFNVGPEGQVRIGNYATLTAVQIFCHEAVEIGDYALISWNVVLMDHYGAPREITARRSWLREFARERENPPPAYHEVRPIRIAANVWIGFDACVLPGVTIGAGAVIGARSVVKEDVPPLAVAVGNPARIVRYLE